MDPIQSFTRNSILEKVQSLLVTADLDFFPTDTETETDEVAINQPTAGLPLELNEDLDSLLGGDTEQQLRIETFCPEDVCRQSDDDEVVQHDTCLPDVQVQRGRCHSTVSKLDDLKPEEGSPVLSFARLDQWDLDAVLQNLQKNKRDLQQLVSVEPEKMHAGGDGNRSQVEIMKKQVASSEQLSAPQLVKNSNSIRKKTLYEETPEKRAAVYFDRNGPDPSKEPARTASDSSCKSTFRGNTPQETPLTENHNPKVHARSQICYRQATGKSVLLQKMREAKRSANGGLRRCPEPSESDRKKSPRAANSSRSHESQPPQANQQLPAREPKLTLKKMPARKPKQQPKQKGQEVRPTFDPKEIATQLEKHRPTRSVTLKQPAAERTEVLYDPEVSHLEPIRTLPMDMESKGSMLLTVQLSSPGTVGDRARGKRKPQCPAASGTHIYNTLVSWFLSLTDPNFDYAKDEAGAKVPFWVAGLQQLWAEDGLALHVLVVARCDYTQRKRDVNAHTPFYNHVSRFLSETSLAAVAIWLPLVTELLEKQPHTSPVHLPASPLSCFVSAASNKAVIDKTFGASPGFYWQTVETQEQCVKGKESIQELHTEVSVFLGGSGLFHHPVLTHYILHLVFEAGLDVCGVRLLYPSQRPPVETVVTPGAAESLSPILALAVRGPYARSVLKHLSGSQNYAAFKTATQSPTACLCLAQHEPPSVQSPEEAGGHHRQLCFWFSGRLTQESEQIPSKYLTRVPPQSVEEQGCQVGLSRPLLCATTKADVLLVASPLVPPCCYGDVLALCEQRGFGLQGLQRLQFHSQAAAALGLAIPQTAVFCSPSTGASSWELKLPSHCLVLLLRKENVQRHSASLPSALMRVFKAKSHPSCSHTSCEATVKPSLCFHTVVYSSHLHLRFVKSMWAVPDPSGVILTRHKCPPSSDMEQMVVLTLSGRDMSRLLGVLRRVLVEGAEDVGLELLGLKWLPALTRLQAQELSPYEVGEPLASCGVEALMSSPALLCALRGIDAHDWLRKLLARTDAHSPSVLMSPTPNLARRQSALFFFQHEIIAGRQVLLSVCLLKPRVWNDSVAAVVARLQRGGLTLVGLRVVTLDRTDTPPQLPGDGGDSPCSGSSVALCLQGDNAVKRVLHILCQEDTSAWTTCYGSRSYQQAVRDVKKFFPGGLCCEENSIMRQEQIPTLSSDPLADRELGQSCTLTHTGPGSLPGPDRGTVTDKAHGEATCLLIPLNAPPCSAVYALETVEKLLKSGCHLAAGRMTVMDKEQWKRVAGVLAAWSEGAEEGPPFHSGRCLIVALQGSQIVTGLGLLLENIYMQRSDLKNVGKTMIYPGSEKEAKGLICYLFAAS